MSLLHSHLNVVITKLDIQLHHCIIKLINRVRLDKKKKPEKSSFFLFPLQKNTWIMLYSASWWPQKSTWKSHVEEDAPESLATHVRE